MTVVTIDDLIETGLLDPALLPRRPPAIDDAEPELDPADEIEMPPALELVPSTDAIAALAAGWIADPFSAPAVVADEATALHHYAKFLLIPELADPPSGPIPDDEEKLDAEP